MRALIATLVLLAAPAAASAASVDALKPCFRSVSQQSRESVPVLGHDFTPGASVNVSVDGGPGVTATANEKGEVVGAVSAPYQQRGERPFSVTLTEVGLPANTATAGSRVAALNARLKPRRAKPHRTVHFLGRGFTDGTTIYGHYVRAGRLRKTVVLGASGGLCGRLDVARRQIPIRKPAIGRWTLQVDNQAAYSPRPPTVFVRVPITVKRIVEAGRR
jgi:hypothetical protein